MCNYENKGPCEAPGGLNEDASHNQAHVANGGIGDQGF